jgi:hypothetical protein
VRGTYGIYFDVPSYNGFFDNRPRNGGQANPSGATPVVNVSHGFLSMDLGIRVGISLVHADLIPFISNGYESLGGGN